MTLSTRWGLVLLGIWLVVTGLVELLGIGGPGVGLVLGVLALVAGGLLIVALSRARSAMNLGLLLLGVWLILQGLVTLVGPSIAGLALILAVLAIAAGVLILLGR